MLLLKVELDHMKLLALILFLNCSFCFSQTVKDSMNYKSSNPVYYANTLSTHPFGIYISRINNNFQVKSSKKVSLAISVSNGNVWLPYVKAYKPLNEADKQAMSSLGWHERALNFDTINTPSKTIEFQADGIIRFYQVKLDIPLPGNQELKINTRMFSLDPGNSPYASLTSDKFIEWFHSNVSGGEDPFARKAYGFNQAKISYTDINGKTLKVDNGDFIFSGIDLSYYYYPHFKNLERRKIYTNFGSQLGINLNSINPGFDIGFNPSVIKMFELNNRNQIRFGISLGALRHNVFQSGEHVQLSNNYLLLSSEFLLAYVVQLKNDSYFSIATTYYIQNSYNKRSDFDDMVLTGKRIKSHWHYAVSHLYRTITANNFLLTYSKGAFAFSVYAREDLLVDNAPDVQTGIGVQLSFK